jgi:phosphatidylethanolamine/phosphatidyl-N-methylethanolamine N-methyltransferase
MFADSQMFFRQWLRNPLRIGAVAPSSRDLAEAMARLVPMPLHGTPGGPVIELGGGTGPITTALLDVGVPPDQLYVVERDPLLHRRLATRFPAVHVLHGDAAHLRSLLHPLGVHEAAAVVSGLPLLSMKRSVQRAIVQEAFAFLPHGAPYIQFTYGLFSPVPRRAFGVVGRPESVVLGNLPPARVWVYRKPATGAAKHAA